MIPNESSWLGLRRTLPRGPIDSLYQIGENRRVIHGVTAFEIFADGAQIGFGQQGDSYNLFTIHFGAPIRQSPLADAFPIQLAAAGKRSGKNGRSARTAGLIPRIIVRTPKHGGPCANALRLAHRRHFPTRAPQLGFFEIGMIYSETTNVSLGSQSRWTGERTMLEEGRNCWRISRADRAALVVDAADYFRLAREAMMAAQSQILLIGWDFDSRIDLVEENSDRAPHELGSFITWLPKTRPNLQVYILKWDVGAIKLLGRGSTLFRVARWAASRNIHFKLDGAHPPGASHHHKILVVDDRLAFCGGIDMTAERWDTRAHRDNDPGRRRPTTGRRYGPWHDATMAVDGGVAKALGELARDRWEAAGGTPISPPQAGSDVWPGSLKPTFRDVDVAISRTRGCFKGHPEIRETERIFLDQIGRAERLIYVENQYFASRAVARAIMERLSEPHPPEIVIINPKSAEGWLEEEAMGSARAYLLRKIIGMDHARKFRVFSPVTECDEDIYVHAKILIVDDQLVHLGSANFNNRSLGFDSECDLTIDASFGENQEASRIIEAVLFDLLAEHLGMAPEKLRERVRETGSCIAAIEERCGGAGRRLVPLSVDEPNELEQKLVEEEIFDPAGNDVSFEPVAAAGPFARVRRWMRREKPRLL